MSIPMPWLRHTPPPDRDDHRGWWRAVNSVSDVGKRPRFGRPRRIRPRAVWILVLSAALGVLAIIGFPRNLQGSLAPVPEAALRLVLGACLLIVLFVPLAKPRLWRGSSLRVGLAGGTLTAGVVLIAETMTQVAPLVVLLAGLEAAIVTLGAACGVVSLRWPPSASSGHGLSG